MSPSRRLVTLAAVTAVAVGAGGYAAVRLAGGRSADQAGPRIVQPGAPGQTPRTLSAGDLASQPPPTGGAADVQFMHQMIRHHEQALRMAALVPDRTSGADLRLLASRIDISQRDEITQMTRWLADHGQPASGHPDHGAMPGMLTEEQFGRLERAQATEFERLFLEFMIAHHEGALVMVRALYAAGGGLEPAADRFAREVNADQTIEIGRMRALLAALPT